MVEPAGVEKAASAMTQSIGRANPLRQQAPSDHIAPCAAPARFRALVVVLAIALVVAVVVGVSIGSVTVPVATVWRAVLGHLGFAERVVPVQNEIVWQLRFPRVLLAAVAGAGLAVSGVVIQAVVRNPLGDPYLLGIVPGASVGAILVIVIGSSVVGGLSLSVAAFLGAVAGFVLTLSLSRQGNQWPATRLILSGVAVGYLFTSAIFFLETLANPNELQEALFWTLGSVASAHWSSLAIPTIVFAAATVWLLTQASKLNAMAMGTDVASSLGIDVGRFQLVLVFCVALMTGTIVAVVGGIGFIGLVIPHIARLLVGADHRRVLIVSVLAGAVFLIIADLLARVALRPVELPIGVLTAAAGAPFLLWLLHVRGRAEVAQR